MNVFTIEDRQAYFQTQIRRADAKFDYCKVSVHDIHKYRGILEGSRQWDKPAAWGPVCCLGTRNGREVDLFRWQFFAPRPLPWLQQWNERRTHSYVSWLPALDRIGRSRVDALTDRSAIGVELSPKGARPDVWVGSFDDMPPEWTNRFGIVYANTLDHAQDPVKAAQEWKRIICPGGYLILCYTKDREASFTDPVGNLRREDVMELFGGELVYFCDRGSRKGFCEMIVRMWKDR